MRFLPLPVKLTKVVPADLSKELQLSEGVVVAAGCFQEPIADRLVRELFGGSTSHSDDAVGVVLGDGPVLAQTTRLTRREMTRGERTSVSMARAKFMVTFFLYRCKQAAKEFMHPINMKKYIYKLKIYLHISHNQTLTQYLFIHIIYCIYS